MLPTQIFRRSMLFRRALLAITLLVPTLFFRCSALIAAPADKSPRMRRIQAFTEGWKFLQQEAPGAEKPGFDDSTWRAVTLPHDWSIAGPFKEDAPSKGAGAFAPTGIGWYRKSFEIRAADATPKAARRTFVVFDGVMANSDVYLNGVLLGHRPYGYVSFVYELTPHLQPGVNILAVRVDNSQQPASRWYPGAGINRQVRLVTTGDAHIVPWGTFVSTPTVSAELAKVHVQSSVVNESAVAANLTLRVTVIGPNGKVAPGGKATLAQKAVQVVPRGTADLTADLELPRPDRWDLDHPALYSVQVTLLRDGKAVDEEQVPFGVREFHFDADKGFFLNGVHHKINGVALHTDAGAAGTAVPLAIWEKRLTELQKLGVNAIRTAHNPPAPEFLDLADRMGFLVMDEMFDCWTVAKNAYDYHMYFRDWAQRDTMDTVMRDRNHPSIILWSAGNEIHDTPRPEVAIPILTGLVKTFHTYDPTRPVTQALFRPNASHDYDDGLADLLDVIGQNYRPQELLAAHAQKPTRKIIGTENTHDRDQWVAVRDHPEYSGQFLWAGIDYLGESRSWPIIGSGSGLLMTDSLPHGRAFERQSWWSPKPMVAMVRRVAVVRAASIDPGYANATTIDQAATTRPAAAEAGPRFSEPLVADWTPKDLKAHDETVEVYTNCEEVELFLNGKSLGSQKLHADARPIVFKVPFEPGTLKAVASSGGKVISSNELKTAGKPARLVLAVDDSAGPLTPDWNDARYVRATLVDSAGTTVPDSATVVHFSTSGPLALLGLDSGNLSNAAPFVASEHSFYLGNVFALVRANAASGAITVTASVDGLPPATLQLKAGPVSGESQNLKGLPALTRGF
jgi:beta-galactosidase